MLASLLCLQSRDADRSTSSVADLSRRLAHAAATVIERVARERRIVQDVRYLNSFDDRMLSDIGLSRCEIEYFVRRRAAARPWQ